MPFPFAPSPLRESCRSDRGAVGKSKVINKAIQDIGMGRYQWELFALCGFGWTADNLWLQVRGGG